MWHHFLRCTFQYRVEKKLFLQKTNLQAKKKLGHLDTKTAKNGSLYVPFSQKIFQRQTCALILHKCHKKLRKNRIGIQKQIEQKN